MKSKEFELKRGESIVIESDVETIATIHIGKINLNAERLALAIDAPGMLVERAEKRKTGAPKWNQPTQDALDDITTKR